MAEKVYISCKKCGKEIENGKYCGVCQAEIKRRNDKICKTVLGTLSSVAMFAVAVITKNNNPNNGNKSF